MDIQTIECDKIEFPGADEATRSFRKKFAETLAMSIETEGMYNPIVVRADPDKPGYFQGIQGRHRLHAQHRILGLPTIACNVLVMENDEAAMAAIAENIFRKDLSQAERSKSLRHWYRMFVAKHPERVGRGKAGRAAMQARKGAGKTAKARGGDRANNQKIKLNRPTTGGKTTAGSKDQKPNLDFSSDSRGDEGKTGTEHQKPNLDFSSDSRGDEGETRTEHQKPNLDQNCPANGFGF